MHTKNSCHLETGRNIYCYIESQVYFTWLIYSKKFFFTSILRTSGGNLFLLNLPTQPRHRFALRPLLEALLCTRARRRIRPTRRRTSGLPVVNFINVLRKAFKSADPKSVKKTVKLSIFFMLLGSMSIKAVRRMLKKLTPVVNFNNI